MAKMTKLQTEKFSQLFETTLNWGEGDNCTGLFEEFGGDNEYLATCVEDGYLQIFEYNGNHWDFLHAIPVDTKAKTYMKKLVTHLMDNTFENFKF